MPSPLPQSTSAFPAPAAGDDNRAMNAPLHAALPPLDPAPLAAPFDPAPFVARRRRLLERMAATGGGVAVVPTAPEKLRNRDTHYPYRADSYFWYLTGFGEPEAVLVLVADPAHPEGGRSLLFCREKNEEREIWDGYRHGPAAAQGAFAVDEAHPIGELDAQLPDLLGDQPALWHTLGVDNYWDERLAAAINTVRTRSRAGIRAPGEIRDLRQVLDALRLVKDASELALMQRAADIASLAHRRAMARTRPGLAEFQIEAELFHDFRLRGADGHSYPPIVAGGKNACVLHYVENNAVLKDGDLLLIDAGCEVAGYASDITRTYPVNGRFSPTQKDVYEIVLAAQLAAIDTIKPGATFQDPHAAALRVLTQGLVDLKLLSGDIDGLIESEAYKPWYMHRTGHWLGLDVHDAGDYKRPVEGGGSDWMPLEPGMVLTVEPGLYIRPADKVPEALWNIGIRIEDDVAVTAAGCHVLTSPPKTVAEIEEVMAHG